MGTWVRDSQGVSVCSASFLVERVFIREPILPTGGVVRGLHKTLDSLAGSGKYDSELWGTLSWLKASGDLILASLQVAAARCFAIVNFDKNEI